MGKGGIRPLVLGWALIVWFFMGSGCARVAPGADALDFQNVTGGGQTNHATALSQPATNRAASYSRDWVTQSRYFPPGYVEAAKKELLRAVNQFAVDLALDEPRPLTRDGAIRFDVSSPWMAEVEGVFGQVLTGNYRYSANRKDKISSLKKVYANGEAERASFDRRILRGVLPMSAVRTNNAIEVARAWLRCARMDVVGLDRDARREVYVRRVGNGFVPTYAVYWLIGDNSAAFVQFDQMTGGLDELTVDLDKYNLRDSIPIPKLEEYGVQSGSRPLSDEMAYSPPGYRAAAGKRLLLAVRQVIEELKLDGGQVNEVSAKSPFFARAGVYGQVVMDNYICNASIDAKVCFIERNRIDKQAYHDELEEQRRLGGLPLSELHTNNAAKMAREWLARAHMDVAGLDRDAGVEVLVRHLRDRIIPVYLVKWSIGEQEVARVQFYEPSNALEELRVSVGKYNLRDPIPIPKPEEFGDQTSP